LTSPLLPRISRVRLSGFTPLFKGPIEFAVPNTSGPFVILGANTLGKTTILQSIVFAIAGIASTDVQDAREDKRFQWDLSYFRNRVNDPKNAEIQVHFTFGDTSIAVRRGLDSERVRGVKVDKAEWINSSEAPTIFEAQVLEVGGYQSLRDFRYMVHRLIYLPESRRNIVWSPEAQLTVFLLVCGEPLAENKFRLQAEELKACYNEMRHTHNSMTNVEKQLKKAEANFKDKKTKATPKAASKEETEKFDALNSELQEKTTAILHLFSAVDKKSRELRELSNQIETEESELSRLEEQFVLGTLQGIEKQSQALALHKLLVLKRCPSALNRQLTFQAKPSLALTMACALFVVLNIRLASLRQIWPSAKL